MTRYFFVSVLISITLASSTQAMELSTQEITYILTHIAHLDESKTNSGPITHCCTSNLAPQTEYDNLPILAYTACLHGTLHSPKLPGCNVCNQIFSDQQDFLLHQHTPFHEQNRRFISKLLLQRYLQSHSSNESTPPAYGKAVHIEETSFKMRNLPAPSDPVSQGLPVLQHLLQD
jgi:hypothetical protein